VTITRQRAGERTDAEFGNDATVPIGDTPNDVAAGLAAGVRVIGMATGKTGLDELREAGATWAVDNVAAVTGVLPSSSADRPS
jgi:phosphoglycolate phosphatase